MPKSQLLSSLQNFKWKVMESDCAVLLPPVIVSVNKTESKMYN